MSRFPMSTLIPGLLALAALAPHARAQDDDHDRRHKHEHSTESDETTSIDTTIAFAATGGVADLSLSSGKIIVTAWTRPEARVHVTSDHIAVHFEHEPGRLLLDSRGYRRGHGDDDDDDDNDVSYTVTVPVGTRVILHSMSGDLESQGTRGEVEARSISGDVRVDDVARTTTLETLSGNMTVHNVRGDLHMRTVSGDADADMVTGDVTFTSVSGHGYVTKATSRNLHMESVSGDLDFAGTLDPSGTYDIHAHSGDVHLELPADAGATLSLDSFSGQITSDLNMTIQPRGEVGPGGQHLDATLGKGGPRITVVTFSGDIEIRSPTHKRQRHR